MMTKRCCWCVARNNGNSHSAISVQLAAFSEIVQGLDPLNIDRVFVISEPNPQKRNIGREPLDDDSTPSSLGLTSKYFWFARDCVVEAFHYIVNFERRDSEFQKKFCNPFLFYDCADSRRFCHGGVWGVSAHLYL